MITNNGAMPVKTSLIVESSDVKHILMTDSSHVKWLSDIIYLPHPLDMWMKVSSVGDIIIAFGFMFLFVKLGYIFNKNN